MSCPICGMPPRDGEPCCTREYAISVVRKQDGAIKALTSQKDGAYRERDMLVCALSKAFPSWLERHPDLDVDWEHDWRWIVFVALPTGQATWHIHDSELGWFDHLERRSGHSWDGHSTDEKYARLLCVSPARASERKETDA